MNIFYNGIDIALKVGVVKALLSDNAGGISDSADMVFSDTEKVWGKWGPKKGDTLSVKTGSYSTGALYIDEFSQVSGKFILKARSTPISAKTAKSRVWRDVKLFDVISDISSINSMTAEKYSITNYGYAVLTQQNETDLEFLNRICRREGYCLKISDGKMVIFDEKSFDALSASTTIKNTSVKSSEFIVSDDSISSYTLCYLPPFEEMISYTAADSSITGSTKKRTEYMSTIAEAERWAKGYLRLYNKNHITGLLNPDFITEIAAGSVINISGFGVYDNKYFVNRVQHDAVLKKSTVSIRQTISSY